MVSRASEYFGGLLYVLAAAACVLLLVLTTVVCADVIIRAVNRVGVVWANEVSEYLLYLITFLSAPYLLRRGQHIRVDLLLRPMPPHVAWGFEIFVDISGIVISCILLLSAFYATLKSATDMSIVMKELVFPEWWLLVPVPLCMLLLTIEFLFRLHRLLIGERGMRDDATSAG